MRRFRFPLERLLEIRKHKEDIIKNQMAQAQRKKLMHLKKKEDILNRYKKGINDMKQAEKGEIVPVGRLRDFQRYFSYLKIKDKEQDTFIRLADEEISMIGKKLIEARKNRRVLERLKERTFQKYICELRKEEQDFFDEVGTNKFAKSKIEQEAIKPEEKEKIIIPLKIPEIEDITKKMYEEIMRGGKE